MTQKYRILSIDGGGIRGIVPGQVLARLEAYLQAQANNAQLRLADCFDLIAGTSTGGILACIYLFPDLPASAGNKGRPKFSAKDAVDLYLNWGDDIFTVPLFKRLTSLGGLADEKYPSGPIETALSTYFGEVWLSQLLKDCAVTAYDIAEREVVIFNSSDNRGRARPDKDFLVRDVARATSAAPTYFEPANVVARNNNVRPLVDGGVFANNPALCAYAEFASTGTGAGKTIGDVALLSIGTGGVEKRFSYSEAKDWGAAFWAKPIIDVTLSGVAEAVHYQLGKLFEGVGARDQYVRVDPTLGQLTAPDMDNATIVNMQRLQEDGERAYQEHQKALEDFARKHLLPPALALVR